MKLSLNELGESQPQKLSLTLTKLPEPKPLSLANASGIPQAIKPIKPLVEEAKPLAIEGMELLDSLPESISYKDRLADMPSLDELAEEFNREEQPEEFDSAALAEVHKACLKLEENIDNADEVRNQLTFIMTELRKYPETAAKIYDGDMAIMIKALRANYNVVAFAKQVNKAKRDTKKKAASEAAAELDALGIFDGLSL